MEEREERTGEGKSQNEVWKDDQQDLPRKKVGPSLVVLHVSICNMKIRVVINLGASVNIILLSVVDKIWYMQIEAIVSILQIIDITFKTPVGVIKDVPIQINKFLFQEKMGYYHQYHHCPDMVIVTCSELSLKDQGSFCIRVFSYQ
ncbi:unnamed protein product [Vicia faba]|uniref:Uncharacterized protein n=1 Tax=Vicia faba TaxID=3906 RepID=A0AAV1AYI7_VICFA|nr:unnamed protein product [Vicia faba]